MALTNNHAQNCLPPSQPASYIAWTFTLSPTQNLTVSGYLGKVKLQHFGCFLSFGGPNLAVIFFYFRFLKYRLPITYEPFFLLFFLMLTLLVGSLKLSKY